MDVSPPDSPAVGRTTGLAASIVRRRRVALAATLLAGVLAVIASALLGAGLSSEGFTDPDDEADRAAAVVRDTFGREGSGVVLVVSAPAGDVTAPDVAAAGTALTERLTAEADVTQVVSFWTTGSPGLRSEDARHALILARVDLPESEAEARAAELAETYRGRNGPLAVGVTGQQVIGEEIGGRISSDLIRAELVALPIAALLLLLYLRRVRVTAVALLVSGVVVAGAVSLLGIVAAVTSVSVFATNLVIGLGLGLALDYCLLVIARYREELAGGADEVTAMTTTLRTAGRTVVFSGGTVGIALLALIVYPFDFLRSMAYAGLVSAALAVVVPLLVLPAVLVALGRRVAPRSRRTSRDDNAWSRIAGWAMRRRVLVTGVVVASSLVVLSPLAGLNTGFSDDRVLPENSPSRQASEVIRAEFSSSASSPLDVVLTPTGAGPLTSADLGDYAGRLSYLPAVARVDTSGGSFVAGEVVAGPTPASATLVAGERQLISVVPGVDPTGDEARDLVTAVRDLDAPGTVLVGGASASLVDTTDSLADATPWAAAILVVVSLVALFLLLGSIVLPVVSLLLNLVSLGAAFGLMVWVFQEGNGASLLGVTATGSINVSFPVLIFCVAYGLAMDYAVFMLSRIREMRESGADHRTAVRLGVGRTGGVVAVAALLIAVVFGGIAAGSIADVVLLGAGLLVAVLVDAFVVRPVLMPAVLALLGERAWWAPGPLARFHARHGLREH